jgi:hypothetical protein
MSDVRELALGELEVLAGLGLSVLLALYHAVVTGKQIVRFEYCVQFGFELVQCASHAKLNSFGLAGNASTPDGDFNVVFPGSFGNFKGKKNGLTLGREKEIGFKRLFVYRNFSFAGLDMYAGGGRFAAAGERLVSHGLEFDFFWFLCHHVVLGTCVNTQVGEDFAPQSVFRKHALDCIANQERGIFFEHLFGRSKGGSPGIARVAEVELILHFVSGETHFTGIDHNNIVSRIHMGSKFRFVFSSENACYIAAKPAQWLSFGIDYQPFLADVLGFGRICFQTLGIHDI